MPRHLSDYQLALLRRQNGEPDFPLPPKPRRRKNDESREQQAVIEWWRHACAGYGIPEHLLMAIPNGGQRSAVTGSIMKREGVRAGAPDLFLAVKRGKYAGCFIEMKHETGKLRPEQKAFIDELDRQGYSAGACYGFQHAKRFIEAYILGEEFF